MSLYQTIFKKNSKQIIVLIDPEKMPLHTIKPLTSKINQAPISAIFIGGSYNHNTINLDELILEFKKHTPLPIILFPGNYSQISHLADGLLYLNLISGNNPEYLINQHVKSAPNLRNSPLEIISTSYLLIDGGKKSSIQKISKTTPLNKHEIQKICDTAFAGQLIGHKLTYLEAGSGAIDPVPTTIIKAITNQTTNPIIVGGGLKNHRDIETAFKAGADLVVIGTAFEKQPNFFNNFKNARIPLCSIP